MKEIKREREKGKRQKDEKGKIDIKNKEMKEREESP